jgi:hypothetical protein
MRLVFIFDAKIEFEEIDGDSYPFIIDPTIIPPSDSPTTVIPRYLIRSI